MELVVYTDGGALNNPGPAASAFAIFRGGKMIASEAKSIGTNTNNVAEYTALIIALEHVKKLMSEPSFQPTSRVAVFSDSQLMVNQLNGLYKVKNSRMHELVLKVRVLENKIGVPIVYKNVPREENSFTDSLVKKTLLSHA